MRLACLFSGGKDSTYSLYIAKKSKHEVECLITIHPLSDESLLFHYPNSFIVSKLADAMDLPLIENYSASLDKEKEKDNLYKCLRQAKRQYAIDGIVHGTIASGFQLKIFNEVCNNMDLKIYSPLWGIDTDRYYKELIKNSFKVVITRVAALGLDESLLGKTIDINIINHLRKNSKKFKFNLNFEGGEAETLVIDCPLYKKQVLIKESKIHWDGIRGMFEILDVDLITK
jgi:diphthine-ammonia ligase